MNIHQVKSRIRKSHWYKQAGAIKFIYISYPWGTCFKFTLRHKPLPFHYKDMYVSVVGDYFDVFFPHETMEKVAEFYWKRQQKDPKFVNGLKTEWDTKILKPFLALVSEIWGKNLKPLSNLHLLKEFYYFSEQYQNLWRECIFLDAFDLMSDALLVRTLKECGITLSESDIHLLTSVTEYSWQQKEKQELLQLANLAKKQPKILLSENFIKSVKKHSDKYHWMQNDYAVVKHLSPKHYLAEILKVVKNTREYKKEMSALASLKNFKKQRHNLLLKLHLPEITNCADFLVRLAHWRDTRKACNQMAGGIVKKFAIEFASRIKKPLNYVEHFYWWELKNIFNIPKALRLFHRKRLKEVFFAGPPTGNRYAYFDKQARELRKLMFKNISATELIGRPAYPGIVRAKVKIIKHQGDFKKLKNGEILVAPNTRPEYVPIMKIAGAIVTEEGGITSHAAVVSRELKVPCVVGVQSAISRLKDGDLVEVDANKGSITKLS